MKKYDLCLFDLDGTLTDSREGITKAARYALKSVGIEVKLPDLTKFIGPPLLNSFIDFYGFSTEEAKAVVKKYQEYYARRGLFENELYAGVTDTLERLKTAGVKLGVATSKSTVFAVRISEHFGFAKYFDFIAGCELDGTRGKKAEVIAYALENLDPERKLKTIMIGDRNYDIIGARENSLPAIGVTWGYGTKEELMSAGAAAAVGSPEELIGLVL